MTASSCRRKLRGHCPETAERSGQHPCELNAQFAPPQTALVRTVALKAGVRVFQAQITWASSRRIRPQSSDRRKHTYNWARYDARCSTAQRATA